MGEQTLILAPVVEQDTVSILDGVVFGEDTQQWMDWIEAFHTWLESKRRRSGAGNTVSTYRTAWKQFYRWAQVKPWEVTPRLAQQWTAVLANVEGLAESSVNLKLAAMSSFYDFVQRQYDLWPADRRNPFKAVERNRVSPYGRSKYPTVEEAKAMLGTINTDSLVGKRDLALLFAILTTCRRSSEILNLRWGEVAEGGDGDYVFSYRYKGGETRRAVLERRAWQLIEVYLAAAGRLEAMEPDDYIFTALDPERASRLGHRGLEPNKPITNSMANKMLKKYARRAKVDSRKAHIHGLRHAGARLRVKLMREGRGSVDFEEVMHLLGHSSLAVTQIYAASVLDDPVDRGASAAAEALLPTRRTLRQAPLRQAQGAEQIGLEGASMEAALAEIKRLRAELAKR